MSHTREIVDRYMAEQARLDPVGATLSGVLGHEREMTDYSPDGVAARVELAQRTLADLTAAGEPDHDDDRRGAALLAERLDVQLAGEATGESLRDLNILHSPLQQSRQAFDLMARQSEGDWEVIADRLERLPAALAGVTATLQQGLDRGLLAARRQVEACMEQAAAWAGQRATPAFFPTLVADWSGGGALGTRLDRAAAAATEAYADTVDFLRDTYAPRVAGRDAVGPERYVTAARRFLGAQIDPHETYAWGWEELHRIEAEMAAEADRIVAGATVAEAVHVLDSDPARAIEGEEAFRRWMQDLQDRTIAELNGTHFDIPEPVRRIEAMIAPPGLAAAMYYTGPSEDFSRPGRTWYPTLGQTRFPLWGEVTTAYHEGVPGHHLQIAQVRFLASRLSSYQRSAFVSGHGEGWALYAERLMDELGYLDRPEYRLGMLRAQAFRAARVVIDIGMHLELQIPPEEAFHPGESWTPSLGEAFIVERSHLPAEFLASEIIRYLGMAGQAISYKVGERVWLECRDELKRRAAAAGRTFDLKAFHAGALDLGPLGLDLLRQELLALAM